MAKETGIQIHNTGLLNVSVTRDAQGRIAGGLTVGNTLYQNQYLILKAQKGDLKEHPLLGCGIDDMAGDSDMAGWKKRIREELASDGMKTTRLEIEGSQMILKAHYP
jgi:hypothetical protein